jgi:MFS family permease
MRIAMWIVLFVVLMDIVGIGIVTPLFPFYAMRLGADPAQVTLCMALYTATLFISTPILGRLSDRYGRKPIMALSLLGSIAGYLLLMSAHSIWIIALSRILGGAMAGNFSAAQAYITDRTTIDGRTVENERAKFMGLFGAAMGLGFVAGPMLGSWLGGHSFGSADFNTPALVAAGLCLLAFFGVIFFVKESVAVGAAAVKSDTRSALSFSAVKILLRSSANNAADRALLIKVVLCGALYSAGSGFYENLFPIWAADYGVISGPQGMLPMYLASGVSFVLMQAVLARKFAQPQHERKALIWGAGVLSVATYSITIAGSHANALAVTLLMALIACCAGPLIVCVQTIAARCADASTRGLVFGFLSSAGMLGKTLTIAGSGYLYAHYSHHSPYYAATLIALVLLLVATTLRKYKPAPKPTVAVLEEANTGA